MSTDAMNDALNDHIKHIEKVRDSRTAHIEILKTHHTVHTSEIPNPVLKINKESATFMKIDLSEKYFLVWFLLSSYCPLIASCLGPLANMTSIAALVVHWRLDSNTGDYRKDPKYILTLNGISMFIGTVSDFSLIMNFARKANYMIASSVSIVGWFSAACILLGIIVADFKRAQKDTTPTEGFFFAILTCFIYLVNSSMVFLNLIGFLLGKYSEQFNLNAPQRAMILYTFIMAVWLSVGAAAFSSLISINYGQALYFSVVSVTTVGLGDIIPKNGGTEGFLLIYVLIGLIILGLIVSNVRAMILKSHGMMLFWSQVEKRRIKVYEKYSNKTDNDELDDENFFHIMEQVRVKAEKYSRNVSFFFTIVIFIFFWLFGALLFEIAEDWSYWTSAYFCFLCLLTVGYGAPSPAEPFSKALFVVWALFAVPLNTILISNFGDTVFLYCVEYSNKVTDLVFDMRIKEMYRRSTKLSEASETSSSRKVEESEKDKSELETPNDLELGPKSDIADTPANAITNAVTQPVNAVVKEERRLQVFDKLSKLNTQLQTVVKKDELSDLNVNASDVLAEVIQSQKDILELVEVLAEIKSVLVENNEQTYESWSKLAQAMREDTDDEMFWISEKSPLKLPIDEKNYFLYRYLKLLDSKTEGFLERHVNKYDRLLQKLNPKKKVDEL